MMKPQSVAKRRRAPWVIITNSLVISLSIALPAIAAMRDYRGYEENGELIAVATLKCRNSVFLTNKYVTLSLRHYASVEPLGQVLHTGEVTFRVSAPAYDEYRYFSRFIETIKDPDPLVGIADANAHWGSRYVNFGLLQYRTKRDVVVGDTKITEYYNYLFYTDVPGGGTSIDWASPGVPCPGYTGPIE